ncbi:MAG: methionyl-tRNA formyltransferase, partial [Rhodobacteraceae bacterium]|nr:methionyl-tRNA formyltransferase [Paracoccaceae bacterium]
MKLVFMGTPDFSVPALQRLVVDGHDIVAVYTQPPRPAGRGKKDRPSPVHSFAAASGLEVRHPLSLKSQEVQEDFDLLKADVAVVVAYGLLLPQAVLDMPRYGCLNIHASLLPRWRGAAPIHRSIMAGDKETGVSIMQMEAGLDTGPVLLDQALKIFPSETTGQLHDRLSHLGAELISQALNQIDALTPAVQSEAGVCYAAKIDKAEARIDWSESGEVIDRKIRGLSPFPGAWSEFKGERIKFLCSEMSGVEDHVGAPGDVVGKGLEIACGTGSIRITQIQRAGRAAQC